MRIAAVLALILVVLVTAAALIASRGAFGTRQDGGEIAGVPRDPDHVREKALRQLSAREQLGEIRGGKQILFGDLHVHTTYSFDAYAFGTLATPYDAYRFARGQAIPHPSGFMMQLRQPLDFYAVTDHALFLGLARAAADTTTEFSKLDVAEPLHDLNAPDNKGVLSVLPRFQTFRTFRIFRTFRTLTTTF